MQEFPSAQLLVEGELVPAGGKSCIKCAEQAFEERLKKGDTNPQIVQMILMGKPTKHFYYRSDQWIEQPLYKPSAFIPCYVGPADQANPCFYGEGTYQIHESLTRRICKILKVNPAAAV